MISRCGEARMKAASEASSLQTETVQYRFAIGFAQSE
jgi:hypothetical protein